MSASPRAQDRPGDPCAFVIFGVSGDLAKRKLLPALYNLRANGLLPPSLAVIGVARREYSHQQFREIMRKEIREFATQALDENLWAAMEKSLYFCQGDFNDPATFQRLAVLLHDAEVAHATRGNVLFYLATPPENFAEIVQQVHAAGLSRAETAWRRFIIEKPFGRDLASARALNTELHRHLDESQIYRIDHYLGKETVQNIMALRFSNGFLEPVWNRRYVDHMQITVAESIGVENRGNYYETAGVVRDMLQNHMLQLMALVAMEPPISFQGEEVRNERVKVLNAIHPLEDGQLDAKAVRGQYGPGVTGGQPAAGYRSEPRVSPDSNTETYAAVKLEVDNWRWSGVPFYLRSGKRLVRRDTEIMIQFRRPPLLLFRETDCERIEPNRLILHIQPEEGINLRIHAKKPGPALHLATVNLDFNYTDFGPTPAATGYERLIYDATTGDTTLFHREDMVDASWRIVTPLLEAWAATRAPDFPNYAAGSWGPSAADDLLARGGRGWWNPNSAAH